MINIMIRKVLTIAEIVLHPSYNYDTSENDIALLKVILLILSFDDDNNTKFHITHLGFPSHFMLATVISLLFFTRFYFFKISESVDLDAWSPACLPTSVMITSSKVSNILS